jgi:hypothetical protein
MKGNQNSEIFRNNYFARICCGLNYLYSLNIREVSMSLSYVSFVGLCKFLCFLLPRDLFSPKSPTILCKFSQHHPRIHPPFNPLDQPFLSSLISYSR